MNLINYTFIKGHISFKKDIFLSYYECYPIENEKINHYQNFLLFLLISEISAIYGLILFFSLSKLNSSVF